MAKRNNRGFSLIEVLVAVGVMSLMSFFMMDMISNQNKAIKTTQHSMDRNEAQNQIQRYMLDGETCKQSLLNIDFPLNQPVPIPVIKNATQTFLAPGHKIGGVEIDTLIAKRTSNTELNLEIKYKKSVSGQSYGGDAFRPEIVTLSAQFDVAPNANKIKNCYSQFQNVVTTAVGEACTKICTNCTWNGTTCIHPGGSKALYRNDVTGQLTTSSPPASFNTQNCFSEGSSHSYSHTCGVARSRVSDQCTNAGTLATNISDSHGGCGGGTKQSCTARATCVYVYTLQGYLSPTPN